jgi:hypothetical protein
MNVNYLLIDDNNPEHSALSICRTGSVNRIRLNDATYRSYGTIDISAHNYAAFFHYGITEELNRLPFISESNNGLDSWDEALLHNSNIMALTRIIEEKRSAIEPEKSETILLGWQDEPVRVAYMRKIDPAIFLAFLETLVQFAEESAAQGFDLEFIL